MARLIRALFPSLLATLCLVALLPAAAGAQPTFPHGVASGDVRPTSATLWTRTDGVADLLLEVATDQSFTDIRRTVALRAEADTDFTAEAVVHGLRPDTTYFFRFRAEGETSPTGRFGTAPVPGQPAPLRLTWSGDSDGTPVFGVPGVPFFNSFEVLDAARLEDSDLFVYLGDTIYSDSSLRSLLGLGPATTLDEYRQAYKWNRDVDALRDLLASVPILAQWDDHEVRNDYSGQTVDPSLYANGRQAFLEYLPLDEGRILEDPGCAGDPLFRTFRWGKDVELIVLDERSCRSATVAAECLGDLGPTLPPPLRVQFGLPPQPPAGCLEALFDPGRTMLGELQKELFKERLESNRSRVKIVLSQLAIQQFFVLPYDRWEGYAAERAEILDFIRTHGKGQVVFLTTDNHANLVNEVFIDRFTDPQPVAHEFVTGPIATFTLKEEVEALFGPAGVAALQQVLTVAGLNCRNLDIDSYGLLEYEPVSGEVTVTLKDSTGSVVTDQLDPAILCAQTLTP